MVKNLLKILKSNRLVLVISTPFKNFIKICPQLLSYPVNKVRHTNT